MKGTPRSARLWLLLATVIAMAACCYPMLAVERRASCAGVTSERILDALENDPLVTTTKVETFSRLSPDEMYVSCERDGVKATVSVTRRGPDQLIYVYVSDGKEVSDEKFPVWTERVEHLCGRLTSALPELGAWENHDNLTHQRGSAWFLVIVLGVPALGLAALAWLVVRLCRPRAPLPMPHNPPPRP